jgi:acetyl esterase/lipase
MMKRVLLLTALTASMISPAQEAPVRLWTDQAPGALGTEERDVPTLTPFLVRSDTPTPAIVVLPGGGYGGLAQHEGRDYALWFNQHGLSAFVVKYRLGSHGYRHPVMLQDAARAVRLVRARFVDWRVDASRIGIIGSSAGGHLASTLLTQFDPGNPEATDPVDRLSSRPDLGILCYPVISMGEFTHGGSRSNLLGPNPAPELVQLLSNELQVKKTTPPCFVWHTWEDKAVKVENALMFAGALQKAGVPFDLHIYQQGRHGIGINDKPPFANPHPWTRDLLFWLRAQGFLN